MVWDGVRDFPSKVILWGGTGQAKVVRPIVEYHGSQVVAVFDDTPGLPPPFPDIDLYCGWEQFQEWIKLQPPGEIGFCVTIGNPHGRIRLRLHYRLLDAGLKPATVVHPTAWIASNATIGRGAQVMAGAIIAAEARIGTQCIINTKASVDHEDVLDDGVEIGPGATLCGSVKAGVNVWVCAGATVLPRITIGADSIVGAGAVVTQNVDEKTTVIGIPAKSMTKRKGNL